MKKNIILLSFIILFSACNSKKEEVINIGALLSLTGDIAEYGQRVKKGIDLATTEINDLGGINGKKVRLIYEDTKGFPKDGINGANKLIASNEVKIIIGTIASSVALAVEPITTKNKVLLFSPAASSPKLSGRSKYFIRNWPSDVFEATYLAEFTVQELKIKDAAILYVNNDYGIGLSSEFTKRFEELGGIIYTSEAYKQNSSDLRAPLTKIKSFNPAAIYLAGYHREMAYATKQIKEFGINCQILADADYGVQELLDITGNASEGAIFGIPKTEFSNNVALKFRNNYFKTYNSEPSIFEANGYDVIQTLKQAIEEVGFDNDLISNYIRHIKDYHGASGIQTFNAAGDVIKPISIKQVSGKQFITIK